MKQLLTILCWVLWLPAVYAQNNFEQAIALFKTEDYREAKPLFLLWVQRNPNDIVAKEYLADTNAHLQQWDTAMVCYRELIELKPERANFHYKLGGALAMKAVANKWSAIGLVDEIEYEFKKAAELDASHIDARWALVTFYTELPYMLGGRQSKALYYANELEVISVVDGNLAKGFVYQSDKEFEKAEECFKKAVAIGGSVTCYDKLIAFYLAWEQPEKAMEIITKAFEVHQQNKYLYEFGKIAAEQQLNVVKAEQMLLKYVEVYKADTDKYPLQWAYYRLAQLERFQQHKTKALQYINQSLTIQKDFKPAVKEKTKILKLP